MSTARTGSRRTTAAGSRAAPPWGALVAAFVATALLFALVLSPRTALYWYVFPLFAPILSEGLDGCREIGQFIKARMA